jgi:hypothetical protein
VTRIQHNGASAATDFWPLHLFDRACRCVSAALTLLTLRFFPRAGPIHVPEMSTEWLERHAGESGKHLDG